LLRFITSKYLHRFQQKQILEQYNEPSFEVHQVFTYVHYVHYVHEIGYRL